MSRLIVVSQDDIDEVNRHHPCMFCLAKQAIETSTGQQVKDVEQLVQVIFEDGSKAQVPYDDMARLVHIVNENGGPFSFYLREV